MKKLFVTTLKQKYNYVWINNLFFHIKNIKYHYFLNVFNYDINSVINDFSNYDEIYISILVTEELKQIIPIIKHMPHKKFYLTSGDYYVVFKNFIDEILLKNNLKNITILENYDDFLDVQYEYNFYVEEKLKNLNLNNNFIRLMWDLEKQCYYNKCNFCIEKFHKNRKSDRDISILLEIIKNSYKLLNDYKILYSINTPALNVNEIKFIHEKINLKEYNRFLQIFILGDNQTLEYFKFINIDLSNIKYKIGLESFSKSVISLYNKKINITNIFNIVENICRNNGRILISLILFYPNLNIQDKREYLLFLNLFISYFKFYRNFIDFNIYNGLRIYENFKNIKAYKELLLNNNLYDKIGKFYLYQNDNYLKDIYYNLLIGNEKFYNNIKNKIKSHFNINEIFYDK